MIKYLRALSIDPYAIHDQDSKTGATKFNAPILNSLSSSNRRYMFTNCIEDVLGYTPPSTNKPFTAYLFIKNNWAESKGWDGVQENWKKIIEEIFFEETFKNWKLCQLLNSITNYVELK